MERKRTISQSTSSPSSSSQSKRSNSHSISDDEQERDETGSLGASRLGLEDDSPSPPSASANTTIQQTTNNQEEEDIEMEPQQETDASASSASAAPPSYSDILPSSLIPSYSQSTHTHPEQHQILHQLPSRDAPEPRMQQIILSELSSSSSPLEEGEEYFLISKKWYRSWQVWCQPELASKDEMKERDNREDVGPGPVDNGDLLDGLGGLRRLPERVMDGVDVECIKPVVWDYLVGWYGSLQPPLLRHVISPAGPSSTRIEFYPPLFTLYRLLSTSTTPQQLPMSPPSLISLSASSSLVDLRHKASNTLQTLSQLRLWRLGAGLSSDGEGEIGVILSDNWKEELEKGAELILKEDGGELKETMNLVELGLDDGGKIGVEEKGENGWSFEPSTSTSTSTTTTTAATSTSTSNSIASMILGGTSTKLFGAPSPYIKSLEEKSGVNILTARPKTGTPITVPSNNNKSGGGGGFMSGMGSLMTRSKSREVIKQKGLTGLVNLGNTCFMNSALQCMSNTKELQEYFLAGVYKSELNLTNPLGMQGQVASSFGSLLERLWSPTAPSSLPPREFKSSLSKFAPSFSGYGQQDSQELLAFLLDGIHEDLNRILKKPSWEAPDWVVGEEGETEAGRDRRMLELGRKCWEGYRGRNDSVIVDLFQGQYRSTVVCPDCDKVSITFDPFMYVTTNLPVSKKWTGTIFVVPKDPTRPRYAVELQMPKNATIKMTKATIGGFLGIDGKNLVSVEEWQHKFYKVWYDDDQISEVTSSDRLIFYEVSLPLPQLKPRFYGKTKPAPPPTTPEDSSLPIVITVLHKVATKKTGSASSFKFGNTQSAKEEFGMPFVVSLTREEAESVQGVYERLAKEYARVSTMGKELVQFAEDGRVEDVGEGKEIVVAEKKEEGEGKMEVDTPSTSTPAPAPTSNDTDDEIYKPSIEVPPPAPTASTSSLPPPIPTSSAQLPQISGQQPPPLFKMLVPRTRKLNATSLAFTHSEMTNDVISLELRVGEKKKEKEVEKEDLNRVVTKTVVSIRRVDSDGSDESPEVSTSNSGASTPSTTTQQQSSTDNLFASSSTSIDDPTSSSTSTDPSTSTSTSTSLPPSPPTPTHQQPVISTGDFIIAEWDPAALQHFFGGSGKSDLALWDSVEPFVDPSLLELRQSLKKGQTKKVITLEDCLNEFTKVERLGEEDTWYCPDCKKHQQATKKVEIWKAPDILVFALKRFSSSRYSRDKIDDFVDFEVEGFNMEPFVEGDKVEKRLRVLEGEEEGGEPLIYDLYAVDNHYGGLGGGHYTAYAKNPETERWYDFDDSRVTPIPNPESVKTQAAYLLFYRRRTARPIGAKTRELVDSAINSRSVSAANSDSGAADPLSLSSFLPPRQVPTPPSDSDDLPPISLGGDRTRSKYDIYMDHTPYGDSSSSTPLTLSSLNTFNNNQSTDDFFGASDDDTYQSRGRHGFTGIYGSYGGGGLGGGNSPTNLSDVDVEAGSSGRVSPSPFLGLTSGGGFGGNGFGEDVHVEDVAKVEEIILPPREEEEEYVPLSEEEEKNLPDEMDTID